MVTLQAVMVGLDSVKRRVAGMMMMMMMMIALVWVA